jgi:hypothetical protein
MQDHDINRSCSLLLRKRETAKITGCNSLRTIPAKQMALLCWNRSSVDYAHLQGSWSGVHFSLKILAVFYKVLAQRLQKTEGKKKKPQNTPLFLDARLLSRVWAMCRFEKISLPANRKAEPERNIFWFLVHFIMQIVQYHLCKVVINHQVCPEDHSSVQVYR